MFSAAHITHTFRWELEKNNEKESGRSRYWPNSKRWRNQITFRPAFEPSTSQT